MQATYEKQRDEHGDFYISIHSLNFCQPHFHAMLEIVGIEKGEQEILINETARTLKSGWIAVADSFDIHGYKQSDALSTVITIPKGYLSDFVRLKGEKKLGSSFFYSPAVLADLKAYARALTNEKNPLKRKAYVNLLLAGCAENAGLTKKSESKNEETAHSILDYLDKNYLHELSLESVAQRFNYCPTHFSRLFHRFFGLSFSKHINLLRLQRLFALREENPGVKLSDLALECGFNSMPTFYRAFYKQFGASPKKYFDKETEL